MIATVTSTQAVDALIAAEGNAKLAAERLGVSESQLVATIASDPTAKSSLDSQLRTLTTLQAFDSLRAAKALLDDQLTEMEPADFARFYALLVKQVQELTDDRVETKNINITEVVMKMLPPEVRDSVLSLVSANDGGSPATARALPASVPGDATPDATDDAA